MSFTDDELERYARHIVLREVGGLGQRRLKQARILCIGAGGLGHSKFHQSSYRYRPSSGPTNH